MKTSPTTSRFRPAGFALIECLVYIAVLATLLGVGTFAFGRCWDDSKRLQRNATDIVHALHAGEQWRADVRTATGPIHVLHRKNFDTLTIPTEAGPINYNFSHTQGAMTRQIGTAGKPVTVLDHVRSSQMQTDQRDQVTAWRWDLQLAGARQKVGIQPWFSFEAVAGPNIIQ